MFKLKDYNLNDTIVALATFPAKSALGVVRISGKKALELTWQIFKPVRKKNIRKVKTYTIHYGWIREKEKIVDEVLVSIMRKPNSYTKEDVVEISCHGGPVVLNKILEIIAAKGARLALPGEFTYRALVRGRIDILQAQGILGIVEAKTESSLVPALNQLKGQVSLKIRKLKIKIKQLFIETESFMNFPEDDISFSPQDFKKRIKRIDQELSQLLEASQEGRVIQEGLRCVICGKANAGKSTLFNCLLREERVIVSRIPGTTRDIIEETLNIRGVPLRIYDTAGILEPKDLLAKKALKKSWEIFDNSDLVIFVLDASRPLNKDDFFLLEKAKFKNIIFVVNKSDLKKRLNLKKISRNGAPLVRMSALKNNGLKKLEKAIHDQVYGRSFRRENVVFLNQYQIQTLKRIKDIILDIKLLLKQDYQWDFVNLSLKNCLEEVGKLSGEVVSEEILESIFSKFCIGK